MTTVTVIMAVHNGEDYIGEAIASVLAQTHDDLSLVVIDDGSRDRSAERAEDLDDGRVRVIRQQQSGVAPARNRGLVEATGELVAFIDHDDVWFADKLAAQLPLFDDPEVGAVGSFMTYLGDRGPTRAVSGQRIDGQQDRIASARLMPFPLSSMIVRAAVVRDLGGFDAGLAGVAQVEDMDLLARIAAGHRVASVTRPLGYYRVHSGAASFRTFYGMRRGTRFLQDRIEAARHGENMSWEEWSRRTIESRSTRRKDRARFLYRSAGFQIAAGQRSRGLGNLLLASALCPAYVAPRLRRQLLSR
jgi:glycosyltransferase involved in cell wall biosynthesis